MAYRKPCVTYLQKDDIIYVANIYTKKTYNIQGKKINLIGKYHPYDDDKCPYRYEDEAFEQSITCVPNYGTSIKGKHGDRYTARVVRVMEQSIIVEYLDYVDRWIYP